MQPGLGDANKQAEVVHVHRRSFRVAVRKHISSHVEVESGLGGTGMLVCCASTALHCMRGWEWILCAHTAY
jgi:hypothetical protein